MGMLNSTKVASIILSLFILAQAGIADIQQIFSPARNGSITPYLFRSGNRLYMTWLEEISGGHALKFSVFDGKNWSKPSIIVSNVPFFVNWADFPSLLVMNNGMIAAHWLQKIGDGIYAYDVMISVSKDGGKSWGKPIRPHRDAVKGEHGFVSLIPSSSGFDAIWLDSRNFKSSDDHSMKNEMQLMSATYKNDSFSTEVTLDARVCDCCQTAAATANGNLVVLYRDRSDSEVRDISFVRREGNQWSQPKSVHNDDWKIAACPVNGPAVSASGSKVVAAWFTAAQDKPRVHAIFSLDGGKTFGKPLRIDHGNPTGRVDVEWLDDGSALVSWVENKGGSGADIVARKIKPEGASVPLTVAPSSTARASGFPRIAPWANGAIIAWTHVNEKSTSVKLAFVTLR